MQRLHDYIAQLPIHDTHEHLITPTEYAALTPDIITALFGLHSYLIYDLFSAGCPYEDIEAFLDAHNHDVAARWEHIAPFWAACKHTGAGEAVRLAAKELYGIESLDGTTLARAAQQHAQYHGIEGYRAILAKANLADIQVDACTWDVPSAPEYPHLRFDLSIESIASGTVSIAALAQHLNRRIETLDDYRNAIAALIGRHALTCVAIKTQHAYARTLAWHAVNDDEAARVFTITTSGQALTAHQSIVLGDWALAVAAAAAAQHGLAIKIHTGHYAGNNNMPLDWLSPRLLTPLVKAFPQTRFILMHIGYPYHDELLSLAKNYANVFVDLCWAWSIDPHATSQFVRSWIHTVPMNKLFGFGGDAFLPAQTLGYALQARQWLTRTLEAEINTGALSIPEAIAVAEALFGTNQQHFFAAPRRA